MASLWYRGLTRLAAGLYYERVTVHGREHLPASGPLLLLGLHRNGAVDGTIYHNLCPRAEFLVARQLTASFFGRLFFRGFEVVRDKDEGNRAANAQALKACLDFVRDGGALVVLPEGTSDLGPRHLPIRRGAARLTAALCAEGVPVAVVPAGLHYERAWAFRSKVEVVLGPALDLTLPAGAETAARVERLQQRIVAALEAVGADFADAATQAVAERAAYAATLGTGRSYFSQLKALTPDAAPVADAVAKLEAAVRGRPVLLHQGVPLVPLGRRWPYALALALLAPWVLAGALLNLPPLALAWWTGRRRADARNTIALWRLLAGLPAIVLWWTGVTIAGVATGHAGATLAFAAVTVVGLAFWYRVKKLAVATWNGLVCADLRAPLASFHQTLSQRLPPA